MSDRAVTERKFNSHLQSLRDDVLPKVKDNWETMTEKEKEKELTSRTHNCYCGMHLLVNLADLTNTTLNKFEDLSPEECGTKTLFHKSSESGTTRLIRTSCKSFACGADEKSGCFRDFQVYTESLKQKMDLVPVRGNRFNMFFNAGIVSYLKESIQSFLEDVHVTPNLLLASVLTDIKIPMYVACTRALGLMSKLITAPLMRIIEASGYVNH
jgi:hypothetical protein